jgi:riboflavin kinase/FMN adenylyltransferase
MEIHRGYKNICLRNPFVTVGVFDGVHLGHRVLLDHLVSGAKRSGGKSVVVTFDPHPRLILSERTRGLSFLSTPDEKKKLLEESGIDHLIVLPFTRDLGNMDAKDFIKKILVEEIGMKHLIVGYDNHFGKDKGGDYKKISECAGLYGFDVDLIEGMYSSGVIISSTSIREALLNGRLEDANRLLGYCYSLTGRVVRGRQLGHKLGFPTANIKPGSTCKLIPSDGVYAVEVISGNSKLKGIMSIGYNPTVNKTKRKRSIEVHILDFDMDLYEQQITAVFRFRLRDEKKFENKEQLVNQMKQDKQMALELLSRTTSLN